MNTELKVKLLTLGAEARIIKQQERQWLARARRARERFRLGKLKEETLVKMESQRDKLYFHRTKDVRKEARSTNVAYGFLRGKQLHQIEHDAYSVPDWNRVEEIARKFGGIKKGDNYEAFATFKAEGERWVEVTEQGRKQGQIKDRRKPKERPLTKAPDGTTSEGEARASV